METNRPKIFISYSWKDKFFASQLESYLRSAGAEVWIDYSETLGGDNLPERINDALEWCDALLLIWSKDAESSKWVKLEWTNAIALEKKIIPCKLDKNKLPAIFANKIYIDFCEYELGSAQLLRSLMLNHHSKALLEQDAKITSEKVALITREGYYVRAVIGSGNDIVADLKEPEASGIFTLEWLDKENLKIRLRTRDGYFIQALGGGGDNVDAKIREPNTSEIFTLEWVDKKQQKIRLRTRDRFYFHAVRGGGYNIDAEVEEPKTSEIFTLVPLSTEFLWDIETKNLR
jgi:hypothetical protein